MIRLTKMLYQDRSILVAEGLLTSFSSCSRGHSGSDKSFPPPQSSLCGVRLEHDWKTQGMSIPLEEVFFCVFLFPPGMVVLATSSHQK